MGINNDRYISFIRSEIRNLQSKRPATRKLNAESLTPNAECRVPLNPKSAIRNPQLRRAERRAPCSFPFAPCPLRFALCLSIRNPQSAIRNRNTPHLESRTPNTEHRMPYALHHAVRLAPCRLRFALRLSICNPKSEIRNRNTEYPAVTARLIF
ncbi:hypothetical protein D1AOALGA4SA_12812 [Olavius algarvensis Delta 1 endosymbiont]|nr:hypothetical protein D1AOALGA4SA_12812 [Olavius algarvensis Delta 1 endosymbiont]